VKYIVSIFRVEEWARRYLKFPPTSTGFLHGLLFHLKLEAICNFETSVSELHGLTTQEDGVLHSDSHENPYPFYRDISLGTCVLQHIKTKSGNLRNSSARSRTFNCLETRTTCRKDVLDVKRAFRLFSATSARNFFAPINILRVAVETSDCNGNWNV
jgi:hypothetical protein